MSHVFRNLNKLYVHTHVLPILHLHRIRHFFLSMLFSRLLFLVESVVQNSKWRRMSNRCNPCLVSQDCGRSKCLFVLCTEADCHTHGSCDAQEWCAREPPSPRLPGHWVYVYLDDILRYSQNMKQMCRICAEHEGGSSEVAGPTTRQ